VIVKQRLPSAVKTEVMKLSQDGSKKAAFVFFVHMKKRCARCVFVAPVARTVSRHGRNENTTLATIPHNHKVPGIKNNLVPI
jgi:hypothetical protein